MNSFSELSHYSFIRRISSETRHEVYEAIDNQSEISNQKYACKVIPKHDLSHEELECIENELFVQSFFNHRNVLKIEDVVKNSDYILILTKFCSFGDLYDVIQYNMLNDIKRVSIANGILNGLNYIHSLGYAHLDLKLENIMIDDNFIPKIGDFEFCKKKQTENPFESREIFGTVDYVAPEILSNQCTHLEKADIWAFGVILYALYTHRLPWESTDNEDKIINHIMNADIMPANIPSDIDGIIKLCLQVDPNKRPSAEDLLKHQIFNSFSPKFQYARSLENIISPTALNFQIDRLNIFY